MKPTSLLNRDEMALVNDIYCIIDVNMLRCATEFWQRQKSWKVSLLMCWWGSSSYITRAIEFDITIHFHIL